jgi:hypothetical protein
MEASIPHRFVREADNSEIWKEAFDRALIV